MARSPTKAGRSESDITAAGEENDVTPAGEESDVTQAGEETLDFDDNTLRGEKKHDASFFN